MKGKRAQSYEVSGLAPVEEEQASDPAKTKLASKANKAKIRYANTYRLEPYNRVQDYLIRNKAQAILTV